MIKNLIFIFLIGLLIISSTLSDSYAADFQGATPLPGGEVENIKTYFFNVSVPSNLKITRGSYLEFPLNVEAPSINDGTITVSITKNWKDSSPSMVDVSPLQYSLVTLRPGWNSNQVLKVTTYETSSTGTYNLEFVVKMTSPILSSKSVILPILIQSVPANPTGLSTKNVSYNSITLNWNPPADDGGSPVTKYYVQVKSPSGTWQTLDTVSDTTYSHTGLTPNRSYTYQVMAENTIGKGFPSEPLTVTTSETNQGPNPPAGLNAVAHKNQINLGWQSPANTGPGTDIVTKYQIEVNSGNGFNFLDYTTEKGYAHDGLSPSTTFSYRVKAVNEFGTSEPSNVVQATTLGDGNTSGGPDYRLYVIGLVIAAAVGGGLLFVLKRKRPRGPDFKLRDSK